LDSWSFFKRLFWIHLRVFFNSSRWTFLIWHLLSWVASLIRYNSFIIHLCGLWSWYFLVQRLLRIGCDLLFGRLNVIDRWCWLSFWWNCLSLHFNRGLNFWLSIIDLLSWILNWVCIGRLHCFFLAHLSWIFRNCILNILLGSCGLHIFRCRFYLGLCRFNLSLNFLLSRFLESWNRLFIILRLWFLIHEVLTFKLNFLREAFSFSIVFTFTNSLGFTID
jgi:hypothetical protein